MEERGEEGRVYKKGETVEMRGGTGFYICYYLL
jgi:hypothetical protein